VKPPNVPHWLRLCRLAAAVAWLTLTCASSGARIASDNAPLAALDLTILDNPLAAVQQAERLRDASQQPEVRFWANVGLARAYAHLEQSESARMALAQAAAELDRWPGATERHRRWLDLVELQARWIEQPAQASRDMVQRLQQDPAVQADPALRCETIEMETTLLIDIDSLDEAWQSAEALERCGHELPSAGLESSGIAALGQLAGRGAGGRAIDPTPYFERAGQVLGDRPARMQRSVLAWAHGGALNVEHQRDAVIRLYEQARGWSRELGDGAGVAAANIELAHLHLKAKAPRLALPLLHEARALLAGQDNGFRLLRVSQYTVEALTQLRQPEVLAEMARARRWDSATIPPGERARLARTLAAGFASQGLYAEAYGEARRAETLREEGRTLARDAQVLRLQARYAAAQQAAENADLRHRTETAHLALVAEKATQRALWTAVTALVLVLVGGGWWARRLLARRRSLADLAMRDDLTGQPNRRAVSAYAQDQFDQARRLGVPLSVALIDLDHFKQFNDTWGHAGGDGVLRAFALAATAVLRGQDRLGRWGGEEWLLVMPGSSVHELELVFERLRRRFAETTAAGVAGAHGCTFSMGAAQLGDDTPSLDALIAECDRQLYRAKSEGRNLLRFAA
jgi:diguanylate cyclase (GGDEF)-like protein